MRGFGLGFVLLAAGLVLSWLVSGATATAGVILMLAGAALLLASMAVPRRPAQHGATEGRHGDEQASNEPR